MGLVLSTYAAHITQPCSQARGGSAGIRNLYSYVTSSGDIRYDNRSYAAVVTGERAVSEGRLNSLVPRPPQLSSRVIRTASEDSCGGGLGTRLQIGA